MIITYAILSVLCGAIGAALAWMGSGPLLAAVAYVGVGSVVLLGMAFLEATRPRGQSLLHSLGIG